MITPEIKAKVYSPYLGQVVTALHSSDNGEVSYTAGENFLLRLINTGFFQIDGGEETESWNFGIERIDGAGVLFYSDSPDFKLNLRPLSEITDEDAIELANLIHVSEYSGSRFEVVRAKNHSSEYVSVWEYSSYPSRTYFQIVTGGGLGRYGSISLGGFISPLDEATKTLTAYQYLQSKGYDLPHYLLGGKTLHEAGLAIYSQDK